MNISAAAVTTALKNCIYLRIKNYPVVLNATAGKSHDACPPEAYALKAFRPVPADSNRLRVKPPKCFGSKIQ